ncbi:MAG: Abortive infection protein [Thermomicrobiales bacterium]|nr:Abortive infection protein [Thermomicrobiales bacterium]MDF3040109.1 Abortive infection protein [Thermomicrobiales bacterium]
MTDWGPLLIATATALLGALGLAYWAYRAQDDRSARVGLYLLFGIPAVLLVLAGLAVLAQGDAVLAPLLLLVGIGLGLPLLRPVRVVLARVTPLDPDSTIDMSGLCVVLGLLGVFIANSLAPMASSPPDEDLIPSVGLLELLVQAAFFLAIAYIAVGLPYWRDLRAATERLGIVAPDVRTIGIAVVATFAAFLVAALAGLIQQQLDPELSESLNEIVDQMTGQVQNPIGALVLGASAGIGEEAIFRGALQPRFGILIPSLLFAMLHGPQYGFNVALLGLLGVSIILGLERKYVNTTAAMITHALFNAVQVLALSALP